MYFLPVLQHHNRRPCQNKNSLLELILLNCRVPKLNNKRVSVLWYGARSASLAPRRRYIWHNNSVYLPRSCSHGQRSLAMCPCVYTRLEHSSDWSRGVTVLAHASAGLVSDWPERSPWRRTLHNPLCTLHSRREAGLQDTRETGRDDSYWPRFLFSASRFACTEIHDRSTCGWAVKGNSHGWG